MGWFDDDDDELERLIREDMEGSNNNKHLWQSGGWTTVIFIVLKCMGLVTWSWWFLIVTIFFAPVAWICGIVWLISIIAG